MTPSSIFRPEVNRRGFLGLAGLTAAGMALTACGSSGPDSSKTAGQIQFWNTYTDTVGEVVNGAVTRFNAASKTAKVTNKAYPSYESILTSVQAAGAAGNLPGVAAISLEYVDHVAQQLPYANLQEVAKRVSGGTDWLANGWDPTMKELGYSGSAQVGLTFGMSQPVLYYNADMFKTAGITEPPATWDDLRGCAARLTEATGVPGLGFGDGAAPWLTESMLASNGVQLLVPGTKPSTDLGSGNAIAAMTVLSDMFRKDKSTIMTADKEGRKSFIGGKFGMLMATSSYLGHLVKGATFQVGIAPFPQFPGNDRRLLPGGNAMVIFTQNESEQDAAFTFLQELISPTTITELIKATGYNSPRSGLADDPAYLKSWYAEDARRMVSVKQTPDVIPPIKWPGSAVQIEAAILDGLHKIVLGGEDVRSTMTGLANSVNGMLT